MTIRELEDECGRLRGEVASLREVIRLLLESERAHSEAMGLLLSLTPEGIPNR